MVRNSHFPLSAFALILAFAQVVSAQQAKPQVQAAPESSAKRTLKPEDYAQWEMLGQSAISPDGKWFAATINKVDDDGYLLIRNCDTNDKRAIPLASAPRFSDDSKWCAYTIGLPKKEADALRDQKKPIELSLGILNLAAGLDTKMEGVQSWAFTKGGRFLIAHKYRAQTRKEGGSDLVITDLSTGKTLTLGNVAEYRVHPEGKWLALRIDSESLHKGVQVYDLENAKLSDVYFQRGNPVNLAWAEKAPVLGFLFGTKDDKKEGDWHVLAVVNCTPNQAPTLATYDPKRDEKFPKDFRIAEFGGLDLNEDGTIAAFGIKEWKDKKEDKTKPEDKPNVDVWHWKDAIVQPLQQRQAEQKRKESYLCLWEPAKNSFTRVGTEEVEQVSLLKGFQKVLWENDKPYETSVKVGGLDFSDWYLIDVPTGKRTRILEKRQFGPVPSREGKYLAYWSQKNWWVYDIEKDAAQNVTKDLKLRFDDVDYDGPQRETPPESFPIWLVDDAGMILYDKYDAFLVRPATGAVTRLTEGAKEKLIYRLQDVGFNEDGLRLADPLYFRVIAEETKDSGYFRRDPDGKSKLLVLDGASISGLRKAKDVDRMTFVLQTFERSPNVFLTNEFFAQVKVLTDTNPQQSKFLWGKAELLTYKPLPAKSGTRSEVRSALASPLQAILVYPADYQPGRSYPMITYIYERLSQNLYNYSVPSPYSPYNPQVWSQNGYFVLMPDITYRTNHPGESAVECLVPAVAAAVAKKVGINPAKVGLVGHSWGGYQTAYVPTQTHTFAAAVAGAPLTELTSMYNSFYWNVGMANQVIFESSQGRFDRPWWDDQAITADFLRNSPVWNAKNLEAPMMIAFGDADGAVDWHQGQYYYNTLRRMGKPVVMLVYPGENHGLAKKPNQKDYAHRVLHWFDVYLKNVPPEPWVKEGVPAIKKGDSN